jgi:predicted RNase H-like HicB family nuclease
MTGHVVVFEGDDEAGYSAFAPDLPGVVAAGPPVRKAKHS